MTPQPQTAMQSANRPVPVKQTPAGDVFNQIENAYNSIARRAFEIFENNGGWPGNDLQNWFQAESEVLQPVRLEVAESNDSLLVRAEVPGFSAKELEINVTGRHEGHEENKKGKTFYSERSANEIVRVVNLPADVDSSKVTATLKDGVLNVEMPKAAHAKRVRVEAKAA